MTKPPAVDSRASLPSVDRVLRAPAVATLTDRHGRQSVVAAVRDVLDDLRGANASATDAEIAERCRVRLAAHMRPSQRRVFNLTGTVLHTNLGRAPMPRRPWKRPPRRCAIHQSRI